jgi:hypothetical protein
LAALVGVEDLGAAVQRERFLNIAGNETQIPSRLS